ncbi:MAG: Cell envelope-related transcriptional attenuator [candidate division WWE3 bacterium GW2011_GWC1_47_10]|uniref:Cell envelope-related transcriptional attenuator n=1 Tax=candidate division WWE3 bacterium GW2011_GWC1_47_10 TaxID=1619122 RepID=A0A0G1R2K1_UNCKA|nr:MAG: Cell envelope-related transcriptional attenuator [candidate division WWE3 bacterium GW2011_GWC1_47_10]
MTPNIFMKYVNLLQNKEAQTLGAGIPNGKRGSLHKNKTFWIFLTLFLFIVTAIFIAGTSSLFDPVSIVASVAGANLKETDGRTNVLILGSDKRAVGELGNSLTDTILVASIGNVESNVVLISLPRDLWVESPLGYHAKINSVYAYGGSNEMSQVVQNVLDTPIHYYVVVDFGVFRDVVNILGGVGINVDESFDDFAFPVEGKETAPETDRYQTIHFDKGPTVMDGETALKYVRSRKGTNGEGTDFARSKRQQKMILAIKDKVLSLQTLVNIPKLKELYDIYSKNVDTNIDFETAQSFYLLSQKLNFNSFRTFVLDDRSAASEGGLLYAPVDRSLYGDAYVLIPRAGDFSQIHAYVQKFIFGE